MQGEEQDQCSDQSSNPRLVDGVMALTTMFRVFLELLNENAGIRNHTDHLAISVQVYYFYLEEGCRKLSMCRAARQASRYGDVGRIMAAASAENIVQRTQDQHLVEAAEAGMQDLQCEELFFC